MDMSKAAKRFYIIMSVLALTNVILAPMHSMGGGMLTDSAEYNFVRIIGDVFMVKGTLSLWVVHMTLGVFIPSVIMLASAFTRMRFIFALANTLGILVWFINFFRYLPVQGIPEIFDVFSTDIAIGSWAALLIFLITALVLICTKKKKGRAADHVPAPVSMPPQENLLEDRFCPHCGKPRRNNMSYCPRCGRRL